MKIYARWILWSVVSLGLIIFSHCHKGHGLSETQPMGILEGTIEFRGVWPDSTGQVWLAVLGEYPAGITEPMELITFVIQKYSAWDNKVPIFVPSYDYRVEVPPGQHAWVVVAWFPEGDNFIVGVKEIGAWYAGNTIEQGPAPVIIKAGETTSGVDIIADLNNIYRDEPYF